MTERDKRDLEKGMSALLSRLNALIADVNSLSEIIENIINEDNSKNALTVDKPIDEKMSSEEESKRAYEIFEKINEIIMQPDRMSSRQKQLILIILNGENKSTIRKVKEFLTESNNIDVEMEDKMDYIEILNIIDSYL